MKKKLLKRLMTACAALALTALAAFPACASVRGYLDKVDGGGVTGWAWDSDEPDVPVRVELVILGGEGPGNTLAVSVKADQARDDLAEALGSANHAFRYETGWSSYENDTIQIYARAVKGDERVPLERAFLYNKKDGSVTEIASTPFPEGFEAIEAEETEEFSAAGESAGETGPGYKASAVSSAEDNGQDEEAVTPSTLIVEKKDDAENAGETKENAGDTEKDGGDTEKDTGKPAGRTYAPGEYLGTYTVTGYCSCNICSGGSGLTYSGTVPKANHTISADLSVHPIGTKLMIDGIVYTVEDMGSGVNSNHIDIYFDTHAEAVAYGTQKKDVYAAE